MSKKKNKIAKAWANVNGKKRKEKKKKHRENRYDGGTYELTKIRPTLDGKDAEKQRELLVAPPIVDKAFRKRQGKCNHSSGTISVAEYRKMTAWPDVYTPHLSRAIELYGEDHVRICRRCYDVVVDYDVVNADDIRKALTAIYVAVNLVKANLRFDKNEVKHLTKSYQEAGLANFDGLFKLFNKMERKLGKESTSSKAVRINNLNGNTGVMIDGITS